MGLIGHEFEALGLRHTFRRAEKVAAATARWAAAAAHPPPTQRPPLGRSHSVRTVELEERLPAGEAMRGLGARMAHGEGAHLHTFIEWVQSKLSTRSDAHRSTHLPAGAARTNVGIRSILWGPQKPSEGLRHEVAMRH